MSDFRLRLDHLLGALSSSPGLSASFPLALWRLCVLLELALHCFGLRNLCKLLIFFFHLLRHLIFFYGFLILILTILKFFIIGLLFDFLITHCLLSLDLQKVGLGLFLRKSFVSLVFAWDGSLGLLLLLWLLRLELEVQIFAVKLLLI